MNQMTYQPIHSQFSIPSFLAMGPPPQPGDPPLKALLTTLGPMFLILAIFYLVFIRPQQKQQKELKKMLDTLKVGDRIVTTGGIFGIVSQVKEKSVVVKIAENTKIEMLRSGIQQVVPAENKNGN